MSSSFTTRSAESLDSAPTQSPIHTQRHRLNISSNPISKKTANSPTPEFEKNGEDCSSTSQENTNRGHSQNSPSASSDITHNNNKCINDNETTDLQREIQKEIEKSKSLNVRPEQNHPMSPEQNLLENIQNEPQLKVHQSSRTSEMPDLSEQPSTFTRSAASTATLMSENTKDRSPPSHNNVSLKLDEQVRKMLPLKQRMALSEDESLDEKVSYYKSIIIKNS